MSSGRGFVKEAYKYIFENDFNKAIEAFKKAILCEPNNPVYYHKLSITYSRNGDMKKAIEAADKACEIQPDNQTYRYNLQILQAKNLVLVAANRLEKGIVDKQIEKMLIQAKNLDPLNIEAYILLGIYYGENKLLKKALREFNLAFYLEPYHQQVKQLKEHYTKTYQEGEFNEED